jgi:hypothetical protein
VRGCVCVCLCLCVCVSFVLMIAMRGRAHCLRRRRRARCHRARVCIRQRPDAPRTRTHARTHAHTYGRCEQPAYATRDRVRQPLSDCLRLCGLRVNRNHQPIVSRAPLDCGHISAGTGDVLLQRAVDTRAPIAQSVGVTWLDDALGAVSAAWLGSAQLSHPLLATRAGLPHWKRMRRRARSTAWADDVQPRAGTGSMQRPMPHRPLHRSACGTACIDAGPRAALLSRRSRLDDGPVHRTPPESESA